MIEELLDIYHAELSWYTGFLERYYLQKLHESWQELFSTDKPPLKDVPRDVLYFAALLFQICAVVLYFMPPDSSAIKALNVEELSNRNRLSERYSNKGRFLMHATSLTMDRTDHIQEWRLWMCLAGINRL